MHTPGGDSGRDIDKGAFGKTGSSSGLRACLPGVAGAVPIVAPQDDFAEFDFGLGESPGESECESRVERRAGLEVSVSMSCIGDAFGFDETLLGGWSVDCSVDCTVGLGPGEVPASVTVDCEVEALVAEIC